MAVRRFWGRTILGGLALGTSSLGLFGCGSGERLTSAEAPPVAPARTTATATGAEESVERFAELVGQTDEALDEGGAAACIEALGVVGGVFDRLDPIRRARVVSLTAGLLDRLAVELAPESWGEALAPSAEIVTAALGDPSPAVRVGAVEAIGGLWAWKPGATTWEDQERVIGRWKERMYSPLLRALEDAEPGVRLAAVQCLGRLPIEEKAMPAVGRLGDENPAVRLQVLNSFAGRRDLLTDEDVLPRLYDPEPAVAVAAQVVLRARGLDDEQLGLAKLMYHPRPELRISAIDALETREDIDPVVWLLQLSYDRDDAVRAEALKALARRPSPDACRRVAEMAEGDPSEAIRRSAVELLPRMTAGLAPLPGTPLASPTAN